ncbi:hypothetical protein [Methylobacterium radiotolerans]
MRILPLLLLLVTTSAVANPAGYTTAEYTASYAKAQTYALAHPVTSLRAPSCRRAVGARAAGALLERCGVAAGGTTHMYCTPRMPCEGILERLAQYCMFWKGDVPCVYPEDGGEERADPALRGEWRPTSAK